MLEEKIIQISGDKALTSKGRIFQVFRDKDGLFFWEEMSLPDFKSLKKKWKWVNKESVQFIDNISKKEKFNKANNIGDLTNG